MRRNHETDLNVMHMTKLTLASSVLPALAGLTLASCTVETSPPEDQFAYARNEDSLLKITTSTATAQLLLGDGAGAVLLTAKCLHNTSKPESDELNL